MDMSPRSTHFRVALRAVAGGSRGRAAGVVSTADVGFTGSDEATG